MEKKEILSLTATELGRAIQSGEITAVEAMEAVLAQIASEEEKYHCYITVDRSGALERATQVQKKIEAGELSGPLAGVPVAIKDNLCTKGMLTTCGSKILENFVPAYSAEAVSRLEASGAVVIGKTNMDEFAMGSTTETSFYGVTRNPWNDGHVPGGSSGGSAAAVAARECFFALGSDSGGSVRQPASYCGVVGMKPTYGRVSRYGLVAYASSLDQIGPITKSVEDCAAVLEVISGHDAKDSTSAGAAYPMGGVKEQAATSAAKTSTPTTKKEKRDAEGHPDTLNFMSALRKDVQGIRIGIPRDYFEEGLHPEVKEAVLAAARLLEEQGATVEEFDLSLVEYAIPAYYTIASAEASSNLERFDGVKYGYRHTEAGDLHQMYKQTRSKGFGAEVKRRIMLGSFVLGTGYYDAYYLKALKVKAMIKEAFDRAFEKYDCILGPVAPTTAPELGASLHDPMKMYLADIYTVSVNLAGLPGISVPCGFDGKGLPIGVQFIGECFAEKKLLQVAYTYEQLRKEAGPDV